jgi:hypothetical protein
MFAIEAADETEARDIGNKVLRQMDVVLAAPPNVHQFREQIWAITAEADSSALQVTEPDDAHTWVTYLKRNLGPVTWRVNRSDDRQETHEWPPGFWARQPGTDDMLVHPAVRAALLQASAVSDQPC